MKAGNDSTDPCPCLSGSQPSVNDMMPKLLQALVFLLLIAGLAGCGLYRQAVVSSHFLTLESDSRIRYEPGAEEVGSEFAGYLLLSIATVEKEHYRPFTGPVVVYICATKKSFAGLTGQPQVVKGVVTARRLFLSAERLRELPVDIRRAVLTHELSHLHMQQHLGVYSHMANLPAWFQEGLAEYVSGGASMYEVSVADAAGELLAGRRIQPDATGSFLFPRRWRAYGLKPPMFYRQSCMFVSYLKQSDESKFRDFLLALQKNGSFGNAFSSIYGFSLEEAWQQFLLQVRNQYDSR